MNSDCASANRLLDRSMAPTLKFACIYALQGFDERGGAIWKVRRVGIERRCAAGPPNDRGADCVLYTVRGWDCGTTLYGRPVRGTSLYHQWLALGRDHGRWRIVDSQYQLVTSTSGTHVCTPKELGQLILTTGRSN